MKTKHKTLSPILITLFASLFCLSSANAVDSKNFAGIKFIFIQSGCFQMGNDDPPTDRTVGETPSHRVCIEKSFYMGETEVTQKQWQDVMGSNPSKSKVEDKPVDRVSWNDIQEFLQKLNAKDGGTFFRLPTEAEWEYAARAGSDDDYSYGDNPGSLANYAWFGNLGYKGTPHEVAQKQPNDWGLYDMHGNVWEWCQDYYDQKYYNQRPANDPQGASSGKNRVSRGGSWGDKGMNTRAASRYGDTPDVVGENVGFRVVTAGVRTP